MKSISFLIAFALSIALFSHVMGKGNKPQDTLAQQSNVGAQSLCDDSTSGGAWGCKTTTAVKTATQTPCDDDEDSSLSSDHECKTATPTRTKTATPTRTPTATRTPGVTNTPTFTPSFTATFTPTETATATMTTTATETTTATATATATPTASPPVCEPTLVTADFSGIAPGDSVEAMGAVAPALYIKAKGMAVKIAEGVQPFAYGAPNNTPIINGGLAAGGGFSDVITQQARPRQPHLYTFTFAPGTSVSQFSLRMLDYSDLNPTQSATHIVTLSGFNASNLLVARQIFSFTSPTFGDLKITGDAITALPGQPGRRVMRISGTGIVRVVLRFGVGFDPNVGFDTLRFTTECP